jgi:2'-5' RNA ligase
LRLFFALWPDAALREQLARCAQDCREACNGRLVRAELLHMTLAFLGEVPANRCDELKSIGAQISFGTATLVLDHLGYWPKSRIVYAGATTIPADLAPAVELLSQALANRGFRAEQRRFIPHVTLLRDVRRAPGERQFAPIMWPLDEVVLVQSLHIDGVLTYRVLDR